LSLNINNLVKKSHNNPMGGTIMGIKKYLGLDRRSHSRYPAAVDVEFQVWDATKEEPRTNKVRGRLTDISPIGACLQTNQTLIEGYHLLLDDDPGGNTPLILSMPPTSEGDSWTVKAQVLWYNKIEAERRYQFDVGLNFVDLTPPERENLRKLLNSLSTS
jgi:hypothetical protein